MPDFLKRHRYHFLLLIVLTLVFAISGYFVFFGTGGEKNTDSTVSNSSDENIILATATPEADKMPTTSIPDFGNIPVAADLSVSPAEMMSSSPQAVADKTVPAVLFIGDADYAENVSAGASVYDLMLSLEEQGKISFKGKNFSGLGFFVEEINGLKNNSQPGYYWIYYVNGKSASVGISNYIIKSNDLIVWKYEK